MKPSDRWAGEFGNDYHARNWVDWQKRVPFFRRVLEMTGARSVLEFGCGPGWNLSACKRAFPDVDTAGVEINKVARGQIPFSAFDFMPNELWDAPTSELVFTCGCLIHIPPADIEETMRSLIDNSYKYVMSIEYENPRPLEIEYRGEMGLLWKRPYTEMYKSMGLTLIDSGKLQQDVGFDNCTFGLFEK